MLTPSRKHLGKAVARRSKQKVAVECLKDSDVKRYILKAVGKIVHNEVKHLCSNTTQSILKCNSLEMLKSFSWGSLKSELSSNAPVLKAILEATGVKSKNRPNFDAVVCLCVALLARNRNPSMNLTAKVLSMILYAGHSSKEVCVVCALCLCIFLFILQTFNRLQKLNLTVSYPTLIRVLDKFGETFDESTRKWRDELQKLLATSGSVVSTIMFALRHLLSCTSLCCFKRASIIEIRECSSSLEMTSLMILMNFHPLVMNVTLTLMPLIVASHLSLLKMNCYLVMMTVISLRMKMTVREYDILYKVYIFITRICKN